MYEYHPTLIFLNMLRCAWSLACRMSYNTCCFENNMYFAFGERGHLGGIGKSNVYAFSISLPWSKSTYFETHLTFISWWKQRSKTQFSDIARSSSTWTKIRCNVLFILLNLCLTVEHKNSDLFPSVLVYEHPSQALQFSRMRPLFVVSSFGAGVHPCMCTQVRVLVPLSSALVLLCRHSLVTTALTLNQDQVVILSIAWRALSKE